jgi:hypothetical protein
MVYYPAKEARATESNLYCKILSYIYILLRNLINN